MLNEPASRDDDRVSPELPPQPPVDSEQLRYENLIIEIRELVADVMDINAQMLPRSRGELPGEPMVVSPHSAYLVSFSGRLHVDSSVAYDLLDSQFKTRDLLPIFREGENGEHLIFVLQGRYQAEPRSWIPNAVLLFITLLSVLYVGTEMAVNELAASNLREAMRVSENMLMELWRGLPYALSILAILGAHELGHYFTARRHNLAVTLPYFIPFPFGLFGTFGAFIQLREPLRNRKALVDVGASGPLAGLIVTIPILLIGLATSQTGPINPGGIVEGNSVLYALSKFAVFGEFLPNGQIDVYVNQLAWAGWTGLFVTGLNLIPLGQLDGGHVMYALLGRRARLIFYPLIGVLALLTVLSSGSLIFILLLLILLGRTYAVPLDDISPLDKRRRRIALFTLVVFVLVFVPVPLTISGGASVPVTPTNDGPMLSLGVASVLVVGQHWLRQRRTRG